MYWILYTNRSHSEATRLPSQTTMVISEQNDDSSGDGVKIVGVGIIKVIIREVFKAREKEDSKKIVAMKRVLMENQKEGFPITSLREIMILQQLKHENVVNLIEICRNEGTQLNKYQSTFYLVFEFCEHDLAGLLSNRNVKFSLGEIKSVMKQLLDGLYYIHINKILHRDMKPANVLITKTGILKLADFGLARVFSTKNEGQANRYTNRVVTLWYRPPELLLGDRNYGPAVDLWGAGCIMAEMWTRSAIMQGGSEQHQLILISQVCGSITPDVWPGVEGLDLYSKIELPRGLKRKVKECISPFIKDKHAHDLLDKLLLLDPGKRVDANSALDHDFFWTDPMPSGLSNMLALHTRSMFQYRAPPRDTRPHHHQLGAGPSSAATKTATFTRPHHHQLGAGPSSAATKTATFTRPHHHQLRAGPSSAATKTATFVDSSYEGYQDKIY